MTSIRLPYVHEFRDRHGKLRRYVRLPGRNKVPLKGEPGSKQFMESYQAAIEDRPPPEPIGASKVVAGTVHAAVASYLASAKFQAMADETRRTRKNILERFRNEHGDKRVAKLETIHIERMVAAKAKTPFAARNFLNTIRAFLDHCRLEGMIPVNPAKSAERPKLKKTDGFRTWSEADIAQFETAHPIGTRARLAMALLLHTALRRSDVVLLGRQHISGGGLYVRQHKTGRDVDLPALHPDLLAILEATPSDHLTYLVTKDGKPFSPAGFTNWFCDMARQAGLPKGSSPHGLRKAKLRRIAEAGGSEHGIAAVGGHDSLSEVRRYTRAANRRKMAAEALAAEVAAFPGTTAGTPSGQPKGKVSQNGS